jgi:hypothetical protein
MELLCCVSCCQAVAAAEVQAYRHLPVTPVESAAWLNRLNQDMWQPFWQPFLLANNLSSWQVSSSSSCMCALAQAVQNMQGVVFDFGPKRSGLFGGCDPCSCPGEADRQHTYDVTGLLRYAVALSILLLLLLVMGVYVCCCVCGSQDTVAAAAPKGWEVEIADVSIGTLAPQMSGACAITGVPCRFASGARGTVADSYKYLTQYPGCVQPAARAQ